MKELPTKARTIYNMLKKKPQGMYVSEIALKTGITRQSVTYYIYGWVNQRNGKKIGGHLKEFIVYDRTEGLNKFIKLKGE